jgi:hypothetical protein
VSDAQSFFLPRQATVSQSHTHLNHTKATSAKSVVQSDQRQASLPRGDDNGTTAVVVRIVVSSPLLA